MKKQYDTRLLFIGIYLILAQIASFTLQDFFGAAHITLAPGLDIALNFLIAFFLIAQFKKVHQAVAVTSLIYAGFNLIHAFTTRGYRYSFVSQNIHVFFTLAMLLGATLFAIAAIFVLIHTTSKRFEQSFTLKLVGTSLLGALVFQITSGILISPLSVNNLITLGFSVLSLIVLYIGMIFVIKSETLEIEVVKQNKKETGELERLYHQGLITEEEYQSRKHK